MRALVWISLFLAVWAGLCLALIGSNPVNPTGVIALLVLGLIGVIVLYARRGEQAFLQMLGRGTLVLFPILLVTLLPIVLVVYVDGIDIRLRQGILAGMIIVSGWLAAFLFQEERKQRDRENQRLDTLTALQREIYNIFNKIDNQAIKANAKKQQGLMRNGGFGPLAYMPFSTSESAPIVFDAVSGSIPVLRPGPIRPVVRFYAEYIDLRTMVGDMRLDEFRALSPEWRVAVHKELTHRRIVTLRWSMRVLVAANIALGMTKAEALDFKRSGLNPDILPEGDT